MQNSLDSIVAIATAPGRGGVGIVRISGADISAFTAAITGKTLVPRQATFCRFMGANSEAIDEGVAI